MKVRILIVLISLTFNSISCKEAEKRIEANKDLTETARFLAGFNGEEGNASSKITSEYISDYKKWINKAWDKYQSKNLDPIKKWRDSNIKFETKGTLFYPFSGPDILNASTFFPQASQYILMGLEPIGTVPSLKGKKVKDVEKGLKHLQGALGEILGKYNYFITQYMGYRIGTHSFNGIGGVLMMFLARTNHEIISLDKITLNSDAEVVTHRELLKLKSKDISPELKVKLKKVPRKKRRVRGIKIVYRQYKSATSDLKTLYYFSGDISDESFAKNPELSAFFLSQGEFTSMSKAASYLMFNSSFDDIRSIVLARSRNILQGQSGLPYHYFSKDKTWNVKMYGQFIKPVYHFYYACQPDLAKAVKKESLGNLPFSYDYHFKPGKSFLLLGEKTKEWKISDPKFDKKNKKGTTTYCTKEGLLKIGVAK